MQVLKWQIREQTLQPRQNAKYQGLTSEGSLQSSFLGSLFDPPQSSSVPTSLSSSRSGELSGYRQIFEFSESVFKLVGECFGRGVERSAGERKVAKDWERRKGSEEACAAVGELERDLFQPCERAESAIEV